MYELRGTRVLVDGRPAVVLWSSREWVIVLLAGRIEWVRR